MKLVPFALAALLLLPAASVSARPDGWHQSRDGYARYTRQDRVCKPLCQFDTKPCDPIEFKIADARCRNPFWRD